MPRCASEPLIERVIARALNDIFISAVDEAVASIAGYKNLRLSDNFICRNLILGKKFLRSFTEQFKA